MLQIEVVRAVSLGARQIEMDRVTRGSKLTDSGAAARLLGCAAVAGLPAAVGSTDEAAAGVAAAAEGGTGEDAAGAPA